MTLSDFAQDLVATTVAVAAAMVVFRRVFGFVRPGARPACANCPSAKRSGAKRSGTRRSGAVSVPADASTEATTHPLIVMRPSNR
jgi:hypothetical protein